MKNYFHHGERAYIKLKLKVIMDNIDSENDWQMGHVEFNNTLCK